MKCEICLENEHKYTCPACSKKTCSLKCCQTHKQLSKCTGVRDKTKFVKISEFSERELLSDYSFLEEQSRLIDSTKRDNLKRKYDATSSMEYMRRLAFKQAKINLKYMPKHSTKRTANKTRFDKNTKIINWFVELSFFVSNGDELTLKTYQIDDLCSSNERLNEILNRFYISNQYTLFLDDQSLNRYRNSFEILKNNAKSDENNEPIVLFEIRNFLLKKRFFIKFDLNKTLNENLTHKTIVEYPTLIVVLKNDLSKFDVKSEEEMLREIREKQSEIRNEEIVKHEKKEIEDVGKQIAKKVKQIKLESDSGDKEEGECDEDLGDDDVDDNEDVGDVAGTSSQFNKVTNGDDENYLNQDDMDGLSDFTDPDQDEEIDQDETSKKLKLNNNEFLLEVDVDKFKNAFSEAGIEIEKL